MNHFSRKNLRFLAPQFGPISTLSSKQRNRVVSFLLIHRVKLAKSVITEFRE